MRRKSERGASLVEFALILPVLCLFLFGIIQFGIAYDQKQSINSAAREGARLAALDSSSLDDIADRAVGSYDADALSAGDGPTVIVKDDGGNFHGVRCSDGTYVAGGTDSNPCAGGGIDQTDETAMPCGGSAPSAFVEVVVTKPYVITIPFFGVQAIEIDSKAQFRCE